MKENRKSFYILIAIFILFLTTMGSTYAYWVATAKSTENSINTASKKLNLTMNIDPLYTNNHIIPMDDIDAIKGLENNCKDSKNRGSCYAYTINLSEYEENQKLLTGTMDVTTNNISNLSYMLLEQTPNSDEKTCIVINEENYCVIEEPTSIKDGKNLPLGGNISVLNKSNLKLILVFWLTNLNESQNTYDIGEFNATVTFSLGTGGEIKGTINSSIIQEEPTT